MIIDLVYLEANTLNDGLIALIGTDPTKVEKYITFVSNRVLQYIKCVDIF